MMFVFAACLELLRVSSASKLWWWVLIVIGRVVASGSFVVVGKT